ncbi:MAG: DUF421 domain-containing protein [Chloroflexi bacterium]|nr:MAG: DUF421 domain-containing protein [Chloroflexota bacterium]
MFFNSWSDLIRIIIIGVLAYIGLVVLLLVSGKRTLSKMNSFDFVITVALGSTLATVLLSKDVALAEGEFLSSKMKTMRVLEEEIRQAARSQGFASMEDIEAVVLETDGSFSVMSKTQSVTNALNNVDEWKRS